jgi:tetratricopeptide (TPR) repeat protein
MNDAFLARQVGKLEEAEAILRQLVATRPRLPEPKMALGVVLMDLGRPADALEFFRQIVSDDPSCFPAANWLAVILTDMGKPEEALPYATKALQLKPNDLNATVSLGRTLFTLGRHLDALGCFDRATAMAPNEPSFHYFRGSALEKLFRDDEAASEFRAAAKLSPTGEMLVRWAESEMSLGRFEEAIKAAERALKIDPNLIKALTTMARSLTETGREREAEPYWSAALSSAEDPASVRMIHSHAWMAVGNFEAATAQLRTMIEENPKHPNAHFSLIMANRITESDRPLLTAVLAMIEGDDLTDEQRMLAYYAAAKAYDNLREYEDAMRSYDEANRLKRHVALNDVVFDREDFEIQVTAKNRIFVPALFEKTSKVGPQTDIPVLVVGMMRSGTTLLEQILTSHPDVGGAGEQSFWMNNQERLVDLRAERVWPDRIRPIAEQYVNVLKRLAPNRRRVVDKNPANVLLAGMIHMALPNARFIHVKRHPVDTALSIWMTPMRTTAPFISDREGIVFAYRQYLRAIENLREVLPSNRFLEVEYEKVVADQEGETRRMLDFLELEWDDACLHPEQNVRTVRTPSYWQVRQSVYSTSVDKWKRYEPWLGVFRDLMPPLRPPLRLPLRPPLRPLPDQVE